jgi:hypothetical protein
MRIRAQVGHFALEYIRRVLVEVSAKFNCCCGAVGPHATCSSADLV